MTPPSRASRLSSWHRTLLAAARWYSRSSPVQRGKWPLQQLALRLIGPAAFEAVSKAGQKLQLHFPDDRCFEAVLFEGKFETGTTELFHQILRSDDVVLDIGANIGWYTLTAASIARAGRCHAFEPSAVVFSRLERNCALNALSNVSLNCLALGDRAGAVTLHTFTGLGHGHSSISSLGKKDYSISQVTMIPLDQYISEQGVQRIDLIKMDVEGAEMAVLDGAGELLRGSTAPMWIIEMNWETARDFHYEPKALIERLLGIRAHRLFRCPTGWGSVVPMSSVTDFEQGDNVLCVPESRSDRVRHLLSPRLR